MEPDFTKLNQLLKDRPQWKPSDERNDKRRAADAAIGDEGEWIIADTFMQAGFYVEKITRSGFDRLAHPAGYYYRKDPDDGDLILSHFVSYDLLVTGTINFKVEVKIKPFQGHGSDRYYPLDRNRLQRMGKAYRCSSNMQHLFVILDTKRTDAPAYGLFVAAVDQLLANKETYVIQHGFGQSNEDAYRIPVGEFRPLSHFLKLHNSDPETSNADQPKPLPFPDEAVRERNHHRRTAAA